MVCEDLPRYYHVAWSLIMVLPYIRHGITCVDVYYHGVCVVVGFISLLKQ